MNTKTIAIAIALIAGTAVVSSVQASESIKTLATVRVRPAADQLAQQAWEQASGIPTLATPYLTTTDQANTMLAGGRCDVCLVYPRRQRL